MCKTSLPNCNALLISCVLLSTLISCNVHANNLSEVNSCQTKNGNATKHIKPKEFPADKVDNTEISADFTKSNNSGLTSLDGNVIIEKNLLRVTADHAHFNKYQQELEVSGNVHLDTKDLSLDADSGTVVIDNDDTNDKTKGQFKNVEFFIPNSNLKGKAKTVNSSDNNNKEQLSTLNQASITSCNLFNPDWFISASKIKLDHKDKYGAADDVVIRFKGIPFIYTPYIEFPISDKRRTGFLFPEIGSSSSRGVELATPWYWNITPNQDALMTPHYMEKRGISLDADYRFLTESTKGELVTSYLPQDNVTQSERYQINYQQYSRISSKLTFEANLRDISDSNYFNDFTSSLSSTSQTHLDRSASLRFDLNNWHMRALVQDFKTVDETAPRSDRPYERLPQLTLSGDTRVANTPILFSLDSELVDFTHDDNSITTGTRLIVQPGFHLPISGDYWFIDPSVKISHTQYNIDSNTNGLSNIKNRNLLIGGINAGLFFERFLDNGYQHTLEPQLYYLNIPFKDQNNTPLFDTSTPDFSVSQLFRENRFIGGDRIGDTNQITLALTSRILNLSTGTELVRASIGQIFYFEDRKVSLDGTIDTSSQTDLIAELDTNWGKWKSSIDLQLDVTSNELSKENYFLHYKSDARHIFNIGYRKRLSDNLIDLEQTDTSFVYAINNKYTSFLRWNYSLKDGKDIDSIAGISYNSCCWSIQLLAQRRLQNTVDVNDSYDNSILVQFVFKGLGSLSGDTARTTLKQSIYGYTDNLH